MPGVGLAEIERASRTFLTHGDTFDPALLLAQARTHDPHVDHDELSLARLCASEYGNGSAAELACIADAEAAHAARLKISVTAHLTGGTHSYGPQGGKRPASTRQHANLRHLAAARAILGGELRGIARGARRFFNPEAQQRSHRAYKAGRSKHKHTCSALGILRAWSFNLPPCKGVGRCCADGQPPAANPGPHVEAWVGPIDGVNAWRLMLMAPSQIGAAHWLSFNAAASLIRGHTGDVAEGES